MKIKVEAIWKDIESAVKILLYKKSISNPFQIHFKYHIHVLGCLFHIAVCSSCTSVLHVLRLCNKHPVSLCPSAVYISDEKWQSFIVISPKLTAYIYINKNLANTTGWSRKFAACQCCFLCVDSYWDGHIMVSQPLLRPS